MSYFDHKYAKKVMGPFWERNDELGADRNPYKAGLLREMLTFRVVEQGKPVRTAPRANDASQNTLKTAIPVFDERGQIEKVVTYVRDLSKQNRLHQELTRALEENSEYQKELEKLKTRGRPYPDVIVESKQMLEIFDMADRIANVDATVLILGETGVGKDVLARYIYQSSQRKDRGEFVKINCGAIPHDLLESELFGYEPGSFTGASRTGFAKGNVNAFILPRTPVTLGGYRHTLARLHSRAARRHNLA